MKASMIRFQLAGLALVAVAFCACDGGNGRGVDGAAGGATGSGGKGGSGGATGAGGTTGVGGAGGAGGSGSGGTATGAGGTAGVVVDSGTDGSRLQDCTGLICGSDQQVVNVRSPALGTTQCACLPIPSAGRCTDCTCGEPLCVQYGGHCNGFSLEKGLLCSQNG
jgi:hypothetical protein